MRFSFCWPAKSAVIALSAIFCSSAACALEVSPPSWWVGMKQETVQLMVHHPDIANANVRVNYPGVRIVNVDSLDNPNYAFIDLDLANANAGTMTLTFAWPNGQVASMEYELAARRPQSALRQGFSPSDAIYLITPDRFANGDKENDEVAPYKDTLDRDCKGCRHGGDIAGIEQHLDYIQDMGFTQIWTMPLLENAMDSYSYHGYSTTDYYRIDPRFGSNQDYQQLSQQAKAHGIGMIMDVILNHIGSEHPWMQDLPSKNWIHHTDSFVQTTHRREALHDPHGTQADQQAFSDGWFVPTMPDMNQQVPQLATYLIQNAIWWVEYADLSGIRVDTYSYSDKDFLSQWTARLMSEYPNLNIVGEEWSVNPIITSYWQAGTPRRDDYQSALPSVMDFPLQTALVQSLKNEENWATGLRQLYEVLATDFVYGDPYNLVVFADNHDMSRIFTQLDEDLELWNMAMTFMLTTRGIPQVFYGTEILMANPGTEDHGIIRQDFPGGWLGDKQNAFTQQGLSEQQVYAQHRIKALLQMRQQHPAIGRGDLVHYSPEEGAYVYFRRHKSDRVMVIINKQNQPLELDLARFDENLEGYKAATQLASGERVVLGDSLTLPARSATVWTLEQ